MCAYHDPSCGCGGVAGSHAAALSAARSQTLKVRLPLKAHYHPNVPGLHVNFLKVNFLTWLCILTPPLFFFSEGACQLEVQKT